MFLFTLPCPALTWPAWPLPCSSSSYWDSVDLCRYWIPPSNTYCPLLPYYIYLALALALALDLDLDPPPSLVLLRKSHAFVKPSASSTICPWSPTPRPAPLAFSQPLPTGKMLLCNRALTCNVYCVFLIPRPSTLKSIENRRRKKKHKFSSRKRYLGLV